LSEAYARAFNYPNITICSAGVGRITKIHPLVFSLLDKQKTKVSNQSSKSISRIRDDRFDLVITLGFTAKDKVTALPGAPIMVHWEVDDPLSAKQSRFTLEERIEHCAGKIKGLVSNLLTDGYLDAFVVQKRNTDRVFDSLSEGIIAHDKNKKVFLFSKRASEITGITEKKAMSSECHDIFDAPLCGPQCSFCDDDSIDDFEIKSYNSVFYDSNGTRKECRVSVVPIKSESGKTQGVVASLQDLTSQKSLEYLLGKVTVYEGIIGNDFKMLQIFQQIRDVSAYDYPVHIFGETGTGKELVAKAIHNESTRKSRPFIPINCGALPPGLIESELFGHVKGSFTGAIRDKKGRFELAHGGTIFLDEVADLPKHLQVKLLRFLQEGTLERVGSEDSINVDVRVISATNIDLQAAVDQNRFRDDLFYRLNVIPIDLPPLRERVTDIPLLCDHFLKQVAEDNHTSPLKVSSKALSLLMDHDWPGNVRELENTISFAVVKCQGKSILPSDLPPKVTQKENSTRTAANAVELDEQSVLEALRCTDGHKGKAAKLLGIGRATLYRFFDKHPGLIEKRKS
jgi:PAS domain S-box-containing protein